jgi:hypothetical protein
MVSTQTHRIEIYDGPDRDGKYHYALFWMTDYSPGHPEGEYERRESGQHFRSALPEWADSELRRIPYDRKYPRFPVKIENEVKTK